MKSIRLDTLQPGEFLIVHDGVNGEDLFETVTDFIRYVRIAWHPRAKQLHLRRRLVGPAEVLGEVMVFSADHRMLADMEIELDRPWKDRTA